MFTIVSSYNTLNLDIITHMQLNNPIMKTDDSSSIG